MKWRAWLVPLAILLAFIGILLIAHKCRPQQPTIIETEEPLELEPEVIIVEAPAKVITIVKPSGIQAELATLDTLLVSTDKRVSVDLGVQYDTADRQFGIRSVITQAPQTPAKPKLLRPTVAVDVGWSGFNDPRPSSAGVGVGVKIKEKVSVMGTITTQKTVGIRLGVDL